MARKGVAVSQIIMLVLGILVLAVVAFLLYSNFTSSGGTLSSEQCRAAATRACTGCAIASPGGITTNCDLNYLDQVGRGCVSQGKIPDSFGSCVKTGGDGADKDSYTCTGTLSCAQFTGGVVQEACSSGCVRVDGVCMKDNDLTKAC